MMYCEMWETPHTTTRRTSVYKLICRLCLSILGYVTAATPYVAHNITLADVTSTSVNLAWKMSPGNDVARFEMTVEPINGSFFTFIDKIDGEVRNHTVNGLAPNTPYRLFLMAFNTEGEADVMSAIVTFQTHQADIYSGLVVHPGEVAVVLGILVAWMCAVIMFLHKWSSLRIMQPRNYYVKHKPKNIETIKVVKRNTDSVIYRNYSSNFNITMKAREKRIQRMKTMPNIKLDDSFYTEDSPKMAPAKAQLERLKTVPLLPVSEIQDLVEESPDL